MLPTSNTAIGKVNDKSVTRNGQTTSKDWAHQQHRWDSPSTKKKPMEVGEIESEREQDPSVLEVPAVIGLNIRAGVKMIQKIKIGRASRTNAEKPNNWNQGAAVRETKISFCTDQFLVTVTRLLKTTLWLEPQQH